MCGSVLLSVYHTVLYIVCEPLLGTTSLITEKCFGGRHLISECDGSLVLQVSPSVILESVASSSCLYSVVMLLFLMIA